MNDISIFVWNCAFVLSGIFLVYYWNKYVDRYFSSFYEECYFCFRFLWFTFVYLFSIIIRFHLGVSYISSLWCATDVTVIQFINVLISWIPFVFSWIIVVRAIISFVQIFSEDSYIHNQYKTFCSVRTYKLINRFANIDYNDYGFFYFSKDNKKTKLCFSPLMYVYLCVKTYKDDKKSKKKQKKESENKKEQTLYETLIADLEKIKKENEEKANKCYDKAYKNVQKFSKNIK